MIADSVSKGSAIILLLHWLEDFQFLTKMKKMKKKSTTTTTTTIAILKFPETALLQTALPRPLSPLATLETRLKTVTTAPEAAAIAEPAAEDFARKTCG